MHPSSPHASKNLLPSSIRPRRKRTRWSGYAIPYSDGNFYPDFVAELEDGRRFVIEHKGRMDDTDKEKDNVGRRMAEMSGGRLLFLMTFKTDSADRNVGAQLRGALD